MDAEARRQRFDDIRAELVGLNAEVQESATAAQKAIAAGERDAAMFAVRRVTRINSKINRLTREWHDLVQAGR